MVHDLVANTNSFFSAGHSAKDLKRTMRALLDEIATAFQHDLPAALPLAKAARRLAAEIDIPCYRHCADHWELSRLSLVGDLEAAREHLERTTEPSCRYCRADKLWRRASLFRKLALGSGFPKDVALEAAEEARTFATTLAEDERSRGFPPDSSPLEALLARSVFQLGASRFLLSLDPGGSSLLFETAHSLTRAPRTKIGARWWDRYLPCPCLPTAVARDAINNSAFVNLAVVLARMDDSDSRRRARAIARSLADGTPLPALINARVKWMLATLMIDDWKEAKKVGDRGKMQASREACVRYLDMAIALMSQNHETPANVVALFCDCARLPWVHNQSAAIYRLLMENERFPAAQLETYIKALEPALYDQLLAAARADRHRVVAAAVERLRQVTVKNRAWPSFMPKAA